ncbi:hypothetical protein [Abyssicoccus albus]|uniref:Uncharacterized protein n=1 Tax=Abyssicoccus albus TaxID=1817405 RepID=A0A3N5CCN8_9BACL|nr:hypothetical protein [Abyssicoccus albus]RPF54751.1 hypothetical protein EDD62_1711 [Abyssicoccus albus]
MSKYESSWRENLPEGFEIVYRSHAPTISFDANHKNKRFYFSVSAIETLGLRKNSYIGMAYNKLDDTIIITTRGGSVYLDKSSYVTSKDFAKKAGYEDGMHYYEYIPEESTEMYKFFRKTTKEKATGH